MYLAEYSGGYIPSISAYFIWKTGSQKKVHLHLCTIKSLLHLSLINIETWITSAASHVPRITDQESSPYP